mmetsp:Transcript_15611/g.52273  ORF Transcript_15611/g.52273 Transcript_15611/m.52273 type:complete len:106 (-) Transcript_15611:62-379(-)
MARLSWLCLLGFSSAGNVIFCGDSQQLRLDGGRMLGGAHHTKSAFAWKLPAGLSAGADGTSAGKCELGKTQEGLHRHLTFGASLEDARSRGGAVGTSWQGVLYMV